MNLPRRTARVLLGVLAMYVASAASVASAQTGPTFADGVTIPDQTYYVGERTTGLYLPIATGGNGFSPYTLTPDVETVLPGLFFDPDPGLFGTPRRATDAVTLTYTARDADGDTDTLTFSVTVLALPPVRISPLTLGVPVGKTRAYRVWLTSNPNGEVTITPSVAPDGHDLMLTPGGALTFTSANWNIVQTVSVAAAEDSDTDTAIISHTVSGYGSVTTADPVIVTIESDTAPSFAGVTIPDQTYFARDYARLILPEATGGNGALSYALDPRNNSNSSYLAAVRLRFDSRPIYRWLSGRPDRVTDAVTLTYTARDADGDTDTLTFRVTVLEAPDRIPTFADGVTIPDQTYIVGERIADLTLPDASRGNGRLSYTLTPDVHSAVPGLDFYSDPFDHLLYGTPDRVTDAVTFAYTVRDEDGDTDTLTFRITVRDGVRISPTPLTVPEGETRAYSVALSTDPGGEVTITPSVAPGGHDLTLSRNGVPLLSSGADPAATAALTFTSANWSVAQAVTVTAAEDGDSDNDIATISHAASGSGSFAARPFIVTVTDNDTDTDPVFADGATIPDQTYTAGFAITDLTLPVVDTGGNGTLSYALTPDVAGVVPGLTFNTDTRVLSGMPSAAASAVTLTYTVRDDDGDTDTLTFSVTVLVAPAVTISPTTLTVAEGGTGGYTVELSVAPTGGDVTVTPSATSLTFAPATLTFSDTSWNTAQDIVITAASDDDTANETVTVSHAVSGAGNYAALSAAGGGDVTVTVTNTTLAVTISTATLSVNEGESDIYTVRLATSPTANVVITPTSTATATVSGALTFTAGDWNDAQTVTVTGVADDDAVANVDAVISHAATSTDADYDGISPIDDVTVTVTDTSTPAVTISTATLSVNEGESDIYTVRLATIPTGNVVITPTSTTTATVSGAMTFTAGDWNDAQTVTVTGVADDDAVANADAVISHAATSTDADYDGISPIDDVTVTVTDTSTPAVTISTDTLSVNEGESDVYTVRLATIPTANVVITPTSTATATITPTAALTFTATDWNDAQTVTVTGVADDDAVANADATISHAATSTDADYDGISPIDEVTVTVTETDSVGFTVTPPTLSLNEGNSGFYTVVLTSAPSVGEVTVTPDSADAGAVSVFTATAELVFASGNWNVAQTVSVRGVADADANDETVTISNAVSVSHSSSDYDGETADNVVVTVDDDEIADTSVPVFEVSSLPDRTYTVDTQIIGLPLPAVTLATRDGIIIYTLTPTSDIPAGLSFDDTTRVLSGTPDTVAAAVTLTYTAADSDVNTTATDSASLTFAVTVNPEPAVLISETALTIIEGAFGTYTVSLTTNPGGAVTVTPSSDNAAKVLTPSALTFAAATWSTAQTVTLTAETDNDTADETATISHAVVGYDAALTPANVVVTVNDTTLGFGDGAAIPDQTYIVGENIGRVPLPRATGGNGDLSYTLNPNVRNTVPGLFFHTNGLFLYGTPTRLASAVTLTYTARDEDGEIDTLTFSVTVQGVPSVRISPTSLAVSEGRIRTYSVALTSVPPGGEVTITPSIALGGLDLTLTPSDAALTFTIGNWDRAQVVTVAAAEDNAGVDGTATISHAVSGYGSVTADPVSVTIEPDTVPDFADATIPDQTYFFRERFTSLTLPDATGGNGDLSYTLTPDVTTAVGLLLSSRRSLYGTPRREAGAVTLTYTARDEDGDTDTLTFSITVLAVPVRISTRRLLAHQGDISTYSVVLLSAPSGEVVVTPSVAPMGHGLTLTPSGALTFTAGNWNSARTVTVAAAIDSVDSTATISHVASGSGAYINSSRIIVTIEPDTVPDFAGVTIPDQTYFVGERITRRYLPAAIGGNGVLSYTLTPYVGTAVPGLRLSFGDLLLGTPRTAADAVTLTYTARDVDGDTDSLTFSITVREIPIRISTTKLFMSEGRARIYSVTLPIEPDGDVTVTPSVAPGGHDLTLSRDGVSLLSGGAVSATAALTFTRANWNSAQTVTVAAAADDDGVNDIATISHAVSGHDYYTAPPVIVTIEPDTIPNFADAAIPDQTYFVGERTDLALPDAIGGNGDLSYTLTPDVRTAVPGLYFLTQFRSWFYGTPREAADAVTLTYTARDVDGDTDTLTFSITVREPPVRISTTRLTVYEGRTRIYSVTLPIEPDGDVTVTPSVAPGRHDLTLSRNGVSLLSGGAVSATAALTFTTANWNSAQTVTVAAAADSDGVDDIATISHAVSGAGAYTTTPRMTVRIEPDTIPRFAADAAIPDQTYFVGESITRLTLPAATGGNGDLSYTLNLDVLSAVSRLNFWASRRWLYGTPRSVTDAVTLTYTARDVDGDTGTLTFSVTVLEPPVRISTTRLTVPEGRTRTYSVVLTSEPDDDVVITPSVAPGGHDLTLSRNGVSLVSNGAVSATAALTFTTANWNSAQTVTVAAAADSDNGIATISHAVSGTGAYTTTPRIIVTIESDNVPAFANDVTIPDQTYFVRERITYLTLPSATGGNGFLSYALTPDVGTAVPGLRRSAAGFLLFGTPSRITDAVTLTYTARDADGDTDTLTFSVTVLAVPVRISTTRLTVYEGRTRIYSVTLPIEPDGDVTVTPSVAPGGHDLTLSRNGVSLLSGGAVSATAALTFTTANWNSAQTVTVAAVADGDGVDDIATISHAVSGAGAYTTTPRMTVRIEPDTIPRFAADAAIPDQTYFVGERITYLTLPSATGGNGFLSYALTPDVGTAVPGLNFWASHRWLYGTPQEVADAVTLTYTVRDVDNDADTLTFSITVREPPVRISTTRLTVPEDRTGLYRVVLTVQPDNDVVITPSVAPAGHDLTLTPSGADPAVPAALTFTTANWNSVQVVNVFAAEDSDTVDDRATISHAVSGYGSFTALPVNVYVADNTEPDTVFISPTALPVREGDTRVYRVALTSEPGGEVTITPSIAPGGHDLTLSRNGVPLLPSGALTFTPANWDSAQMVTVAAGEDSDDFDDTATIRHAVSGYGSVTPERVIVTVADNNKSDTAPSFAGAMPGNQTYFTRESIADLPLPAATGGNGFLSYALTPDVATAVPGLGFDHRAHIRRLFGTPLHLTDALMDTVTLTYTVRDDDGDTAMLTFSVTVLERHPVEVWPSALGVYEGHTSTYYVGISSISHNNIHDYRLLTGYPGSKLVVIPSIVPERHGLTLSLNGVPLLPGEALTYTSPNVLRRDAVKVFAAEDSVSVGDIVTISLAVRGYHPLTNLSVVATVLPPIKLPRQTYTAGTPITPLILPGADSGPYLIEGRTIPSFWVQSGDGIRSYALTPVADIPDGLTFDGNTRVLSGTPTAATPPVTLDYVMIAASRNPIVFTLPITVRAPPVFISPPTLALREEGTGTYSVALSSEPDPGAEVIVTPSVAPGGHGLTLSRDGVPLSSGGALTFTTGDWNTAQTVTVTAAADGDSVDETVTISHAVSGHPDVTAAAPVSVTVADDTRASTAPDFAADATPPDQTYIAEERIAGLTLPAATGGNGGLSYALTPDVTTAVPGLAFNARTRVLFGTPFNPPLSGPPMPSFMAANAVTLTYTVSDARGNTDTLTFSVTALTKPPVRISPDPLTVPDGYSSTFSVRATHPLDHGLRLVITPSIIAPDGHGLTLSRNGVPLLPSGALTFGRYNWNSVQMITVHAAEDDDSVEDTATISLAVRRFHPLTDLSAIIEVVPVLPISTVPDQTYTAGVQIAPLQLPRGFGNPPITYTLTPVADIPDGLMFDGNTRTLSGTPTTAADAVTLTYITRDVDGDTFAATLSITVRALTARISPTALTVIEGESNTYGVSLPTAPDGDVTVTPSIASTGHGLTLSRDGVSLTPGGALTFTTANWNTAQTVTVVAAANSAGMGNTVTISHAVDGYGDVTTAAPVSVTIEPDTAPAFAIGAAPPAQTYFAGQFTSLTLPDAGGGNGGLSYALTPAVGSVVTGLDFFHATRFRLLVGTPRGEVDAMTFTYTVTDSDRNTDAGDADTLTFSITVLAPPVRISPTRLTVREGGGNTYDVALETEPVGEVVITPSVAADEHDLTLTPNGVLTFTTMNWNTAQTVTVAVAEDAMRTPDTVTISHAVSGYDGYTTADSVSVTIEPDTAPEFADGAAPLAQTYFAGVRVRTVRLPVPIRGGNGVLSYTLTPQVSVAVPGLAFDDNTRELRGTPFIVAEAVTLTYTVRDEDGDTDSLTFSVTVAAAPIPNTLTVPEGASRTYELVLTEAPTGDWVITPSVAPQGHDLTLSRNGVSLATGGAALTFAPDNWNIAQTVTVTAAEDDDSDNDTATITHEVDGLGLVTDLSTLVTVTDNNLDTNPEFADDAAPDDRTYTAGVAIADLTLPEATGGNGGLSYALAPDVAGAVPGLTFDADTRVLSGAPSTVASAVTLTYTAADVDADADTDALTFSVTVVAQVVPAVTISPTTLTVIEDGDSGAYRVALTTNPGGEVTVTPTATPADNDLTLSRNGVPLVPSGAVLTFTTANWNTAQTVTLTAATDTDATDDTATISHTVAGYGAVTTAEAVRVTVTDSNPPAFDTAAVVHTFPPGVAIAPTVLPVATGGRGMLAYTLTPDSAIPSGLSFTAATRTVSGTPAAGAVAATLTYTATDSAGATATRPVVLVVGSQILAGFAQAALTNSGDNALTLLLDSAPASDVTVGVEVQLFSGSAPANYRFGPGILTFTPANWNIPQTVTTATDGFSSANAGQYIATIQARIGSREVFSGAAFHSVFAEYNAIAAPDTLSVNEGGAGFYTVVLAPVSPAAGQTVTVTPASADDTVAGVSGALTFTDADWNVPKTVTVTGVVDGDSDDDPPVSITHQVTFTGDDTYLRAGTNTVTVTVTDIDAEAFIGGADASAAEGTLLNVPVEIRGPARTAASTVSFIFTGTATTADYEVVTQATPAGERITFDPAAKTGSIELSAAQSSRDLVVRLLDDSIADAGETFVVTLTGHSGNGGAGGPAHTFAPAARTVTLADALAFATTVDDQTYNLTVDVSETLPEATGGIGGITYALTPTSGIPAGLSFDETSRELRGTPTAVTPATPLTYTATDAANVSVSQTFAVTVNPAPVAAALVFDSTALSVDEGGTGGYTVELSVAPDSGEVTVTPDATGLTLAPATLTFTATSWNTAQSVIITAARDDDTANETLTVSHAVAGAGNYAALATAGGGDVTVTVTDTSTPAVTISDDTLSVNEGGSDTYTVRLATIPTGNVVITPTSTATATLSPTGALTFTAGDWNDEQTVTVTGVADADAVANVDATISHTAASADADYDNITPIDEVTVTVTETDSVGFTVTPQTLSLNEGDSGFYTVVLTSAPSVGEVTVTPDSPDSDAVSIYSGTDELTFTSADWNVAQTVSVRAETDTDANDEMVVIGNTVTVSDSSSDYNNETAAGVTVSVTDPTAPDTVPTFGAATVDDENYTAGVQIPDLTLPAASGGNGAPRYTLTPDIDTAIPGLTFDDTTRVVSGTPDAATAAVTLTYTAADSDGNNAATDTASLTFAITVVPAPTLVFAPTALSVDEGGTGTYGIELSVAPTTGNVVVTPSATGLTLAPATLTFTDATWNTAQSVTITAARDDDTVNETIAVSHAVSGAGNYTGLATAGGGDFTVTVTDTSIPAVTISDDTLSVNEGGSDTYTVRLATIPTANVVITPTATSTATVSGPLTFTAGNWNDAQTITVTGVADDDAVANTDAVISHAATGAAEYVAVSTIDDVTVTVTETDSVGFTVNPTTVNVDEDATLSYTVVLTSAPSVGEVTVTPSSADTGAVAIDISTAVLVFDASNWNMPQVVSVGGVEDADADDESVVITNAVTVSVASSDYAGQNAASVTVNVTDTDMAGVTISATTLSIDEDGDGTYTIELTSAPSGGGDATVTPVSADTTIATVSGALVFGINNWQMAQNVVVTGVADDDVDNEMVSITHTVSGYTASAGKVDVTVTDTSVRGVTVPTTPVTVTEGTPGTYEVVLNTQPTGNVTVTPASDDDDIATVSGALTFSAGNWDTAQNITVTGTEDADSADESTSITHAVTGADYESNNVTAANVAVTVNDDETAGVTISTATLAVGEGSNNTYTVELTTPPTGPVAVVLMIDNSDVTADATTLNFTTGNWNTEQTVTISATEDPDGNHDTASITHTVSGGGYDGASITNAVVTVTVTDNDPLGIMLSATTLSVGENGTGNYTVELATEPDGNVTITPTSADPAAATVSAALTFTDSNWNTAQQVEVTGVADDDATDENFNITHAASGSADYAAVDLTAALVTVTVTDNNTRDITLSGTMPVTVAEGATANYGVVLDTQPTGDVTVTPSSDTPAVATVSAALVFGPSNWNTVQNVVVTGVEDANTEDDSASITHAVTGADYATVTLANVAVTVTDNDMPGVTISTATLTIGEDTSSGAGNTYNVVLNTEPSGDVAVALSSDNTDVTLNAATLNFGDWQLEHRAERHRERRRRRRRHRRQRRHHAHR